jgi:hypothetical protein
LSNAICKESKWLLLNELRAFQSVMVTPMSPERALCRWLKVRTMKHAA